MKNAVLILLALVALVSRAGQIPANASDFNIALPEHQGQLRWHADGFKIVQSSAKPNGQEIGIRGRDESGRLTFLGFLFAVSGQTSLTSAKCRDGEIDPLRKSNPTFTILEDSQIVTSNGLPVMLVTYRARNPDGRPVYSMRGFVATSDICGDLEFYSDRTINPGDAELKKVFETYQFDLNYTPQFKDIFEYAEILYREGSYQAAAPLFEQSLAKLTEDKDNLTMRRIATDQAGMAYGISGDTEKARSIFKSAIVKDPNYPMYYYNLACADAQDKDLAAARAHLQQAFARKANMLPGETMPNPSKDDSFLPYRNNTAFWKFVESLH
jgi:tetratricopeptide (TPR) repeat protein